MINISKDDNALDWIYEGYLQDYLQGLLDTSSYESRARENIERMINDNDMTKEVYDKLAFDLNSNQLDRISSGLTYNQTDIKKHLRKIC